MINQKRLSEALKKGFIRDNHFYNSPKFIETNSSLVIFTKNNAFKIIKQEKGKDYADMNSRYLGLQEELRINSEISPKLYQSLVPISVQREKIIIGAKKSYHQVQIVEYALKMKKLKQNSRVYNKLMNGTFDRGHSGIIAEEIANFHLSKLRGSLTQEDKILIREFSSFGSLKKVILEDFAMFERSKSGFVPRAITESNYQKIKQYISRFLQDNKPLFLERINQRFILPVHGDFHSTNMFVEEKSFYAIDRALRKKFRVSDILKDPAYLSVELEAFGFDKEKEFFLASYQEKIKDPYFDKLLSFYMCRLAFVKGIVNFYSDPPGQLKIYFDIACKYASN